MSSCMHSQADGFSRQLGLFFQHITKIQVAGKPRFDLGRSLDWCQPGGKQVKPGPWQVRSYWANPKPGVLTPIAPLQQGASLETPSFHMACP